MSTVTALETVHLGTLTGPIEITGGAQYDSTHPLVKAYPHLFSTPEPELVEVEAVPEPAPRKVAKKAVADG